MTSTRPRVIGIARSPAYSPFQHATNDQAILEATLAELEGMGWSARCLHEQDIGSVSLPSAGLYLNMCQGSDAALALLAHESEGLRFFNLPSSTLRCHRERLIAELQRGRIPFPPTVLLRTARSPGAPRPIALQRLGPGPWWLKRGGVHAERVGDVRLLPPVWEELERGLAKLAARGIRLAAVQTHVEGPVVKFYGVGKGTFFHAYLADSKTPVPPDLIEPARLRALAFRAAALLKLDIFGGDVVIAAPGRPVLIDLNDWPSFAPVRENASRAIARYVHASRLQGALS